MDFIRNIGERLRDLGSVLWRCLYSIGLTLAGLAGFLFVPQGAEVLRLSGQPGWNFPLFLVSVACWSLAAWYSARLNLGRVFDGHSRVDQSSGAFLACLRKWLPRALGVLPGAVLALQLQGLGQTRLALAFALATLALGVFMLTRRHWFRGRFAGAPARFWQLERRSVFAAVGAIVLSFAVMLLVWWQPVAVTRYLTAPVLLCLALASWILFGDLVLTYFFRQARLPSMAALPLLLFVASSCTNDNHGVALVADATPAPSRPTVAARLDAWLAAHEASGALREGEEFPVFLVAAEGGGIRAAYWGGDVLAKLQDESGGRFGRHVFALSGVSGGSLASAAFTALLADDASGALARAPCARRPPPPPNHGGMRHLNRRGFINPLLG
jgi:hypothetical protein